MSKWAAQHIADAINNHKEDRPYVLGLPTGSSPLGVYKNLVEMNKKGEVTFKNVVTFNMDEYVGLPKEHDQSYWYFMHENFFNHIDIPRENINILNGMTDDPEGECKRYEEKIQSYGGIDLFLGGSGVDGHIAFNDPHVADFNDPLKIKKVDLDQKCRQQQVNDGCFQTIDQVPTHALTLTIPTLYNVENVFCVVPAPSKAEAVKNTVTGPVSEVCPASILRKHANATLYVDADSSALL